MSPPVWVGGSWPKLRSPGRRVVRAGDGGTVKPVTVVRTAPAPDPDAAASARRRVPPQRVEAAAEEDDGLVEDAQRVPGLLVGFVLRQGVERGDRGRAHEAGAQVAGGDAEV